MQCPNCQLENPEAATHCAVCRQPLGATPDERADGIWLIPPASAPSESTLGGAALAAELARQQASAQRDDKMAAKAADKWLPRLVFFLGIFIVGVGLGVSGSNWFKLSEHASAAADDKAQETPRAGRYRSTQPGNPISATTNAGHSAALEEGSVAASAMPQQPVAEPAPVAVPAPAPIPAAVTPPAAERAAQPTAVSATPAAKRRRVAKLKKSEPVRNPAAAPPHLQKQSAKRTHRSSFHRKPASRPDEPPTAPLQMAELKSGSKRTLLNQCENRVSWIEREKCRWQLCSNQWGQHGCPAYPPPLNQQ